MLTEGSSFQVDNSAKEEHFQFLQQLDVSTEEVGQNDSETEEEAENEGKKEDAIEENENGRGRNDTSNEENTHTLSPLHSFR